MLRNRPWCNIKAQQANLLLKGELWDWLECAVIDRRWVCFKRDTPAFTARLRFQITQRKCFEMCRDKILLLIRPLQYVSTHRGLM